MELRYYPARMDASLGEPIRSYMSTLLDDLRATPTNSIPPARA